MDSRLSYPVGRPTHKSVAEVDARCRAILNQRSLPRCGRTMVSGDMAILRDGVILCTDCATEAGPAHYPKLPGQLGTLRDAHCCGDVC